MKLHDLVIDEEFSQSAGRQQDPDEIQELAKSLLQDGCRDPLVCWNDGTHNIVVDGTHRKLLCDMGRKRLEEIAECGCVSHVLYANKQPAEDAISYTVTQKEFPDRVAVMAWIMQNQLARRNLSIIGKNILRNKLFEILFQQTDGDKVCNDHKKAQPSVQRTVEEVAKRTGSTVRQVTEARVIGKALNKLGSASPSLRQDAERGLLPAASIKALASVPESVVKSLEGTPGKQLRTAARAAITQAAVDQPSTAPMVHIKELAELEKAAGKLIRTNSKALKACGGRPSLWAFRFHEAIRFLMSGHDNPDGSRSDGIVDIIFKWQKDAEGR